MNKVQFLFTTILAALCLNSCASFKAKYRSDFSRLDNSHTLDSDFVVYLVGDAGNAPLNMSTVELDYLNEELTKESSNSAIVWLGDNIYPVGLAPEAHPDRALGEHRLKAQMNCLSDFKGRAYFIPGNHDWYEYGKAGIQRQEALIEKYIPEIRKYNPWDQDNYFLPDDACGAIHSIPMNDDIVMILMDSNWYLQDERDQLDHCDHNDPERFLSDLKTEIRKYTGKQLIICLHHPPYSYGPHGSHFSFKDYVFPLTQLKSGLYLPLPFSGIVVNQMRAYITEQDIKHRNYKLLKSVLESELISTDNAIVAAGHEHNLQYISKDDIHYIVSGAGSKNNAVALGKYSQFAVGKKGFVKLTFHKKGFRIDYIVPSEKKKNIYFRKDVSKSYETK